jgi:hypothetical protein
MNKKYKDFNTLPTWVKPIWTGDEDDHELVNDNVDFKWSGDNPPPAIGAKIKTYLNQMGTGTVLGYFAEHGWLGVLVQLDKNPKWRRDQNGGKNPPACLFGIDLQPRSEKSK